MDITGKIVKILPLQSGQGKNGEWKKQEFVIQTEGPYPKNICFTMWGAQIDKFDLQENTMANVSFDAESREFNGRWYTDLKAWRVQKTDNNTQNNPNNSQNDDEFINAQNEAMPNNSIDDDLPF